MGNRFKIEPAQPLSALMDQYRDDPFFIALQRENEPDRRTTFSQTLLSLLPRFHKSPTAGQYALSHLFSKHPDSPLYEAYQRSNFLTYDTDTPFKITESKSKLDQLRLSLLLLSHKVSFSIRLSSVHPALHERTELLKQVHMDLNSVIEELSLSAPRKRVVKENCKNLGHTLDAIKGENTEYKWLNPLREAISPYLKDTESTVQQPSKPHTLPPAETSPPPGSTKDEIPEVTAQLLETAALLPTATKNVPEVPIETTTVNIETPILEFAAPQAILPAAHLVEKSIQKRTKTRPQLREPDAPSPEKAQPMPAESSQPASIFDTPAMPGTPQHLVKNQVLIQLEAAGALLAELEAVLPDRFKLEYDSLCLRLAQSRRDVELAAGFGKMSHMEHLNRRGSVFLGQVRLFKDKLAGSDQPEGISVISENPDYKPDISNHPFPEVRILLKSIGLDKTPIIPKASNGTRTRPAARLRQEQPTIEFNLSRILWETLQNRYLGNLPLLAADLTVNVDELRTLIDGSRSVQMTADGLERLATLLYLDPFSLLARAYAEQPASKGNPSYLAKQIMILGLEMLLEKRGITPARAKQYGITMEVDWGNKRVEEKISHYLIRQIYCTSLPDLSSLRVIATGLYDLLRQRHHDDLARILAEAMDHDSGSRMNWQRRVLLLREMGWEAFGTLPVTGPFYLQFSDDFSYSHEEGYMEGLVVLSQQNPQNARRTIHLQRNTEDSIQMVWASTAMETQHGLKMLHDAGLIEPNFSAKQSLRRNCGAGKSHWESDKPASRHARSRAISGPVGKNAFSRTRLLR